MAEKGRAALKTLGDSDFSLVITDVRMPHVDGLELLRKIQASAPELPVSAFQGVCDASTTSRPIPTATPIRPTLIVAKE